MKKYIAVPLSVIFALALIFSAPSSLLFLYNAKAQVGSSLFQGAATRASNVLPFQNSLSLVPPVANAGQNKMVLPGATVFLNGSGSFDPNRGGSIINYRWTQVAGIPVNLQGGNGVGIGSATVPRSSSSSSGNTPFAIFTVPAVPLNVATPLAFSLTVTDNLGLTSNPSFVSVLIIPQQQQQQQRQLQQPSITPQQSSPQQQLPLLQRHPFIGTNAAHGNGPSSPSLNGQLQTPYRTPNSGLIGPSLNNPNNYPSQYRSPAYQYHPPNQGTSINNPFTSKQSNASLAGTGNRIPFASNAIRNQNQNPILTSPLNSGNLNATATNLTSHAKIVPTPNLPAVNGTLTEPKNNGIVAASKAGQTRGTTLTGVTPKSESVTKNSLKNTLGQPSKTSQTNASRGQNQSNTSLKSTNLNAKPGALAALAPTNGTAKNITKTNNTTNTANTSSRFASASPLAPSQSCAPPASTAGPVVNCVTVGSAPSDAISVPGVGIYVTNSGDNTVSVIDTTIPAYQHLAHNTQPPVTATIPVGSGPSGEVASTIFSDSGTTSYVYVSDTTGNTVSVIDANPSHAGPGGTFNTVIATITGIPDPTGPAFDSSNNEVYVPSGTNNAIYVIDADPSHIDTFNTVLNPTSPIPVGTSPNQALYDPNNNDIYVTNRLSNTVSVIDGSTNTPLPNPITVGTNPITPSFDSLNGDIYVTNSGSNTVSVIDGSTNTVINSIPVGTAPDGGAFSSFTGYVYISNSGSNNIFVIDGRSGSPTENQVLPSCCSPIATGLTPAGAGFDPNTGRDLYVTNHGGNTVTVISDIISLTAQDNAIAGQSINVVGDAFVPVGPYGTTTETVTVDWGDGSSNTTNIGISQAQSYGGIWPPAPDQQPLTHTYATSGTFTIKAQLVVACEFCNEFSSYATKSITVAPPLAVTSTTPQDGAPPPPVPTTTSISATFNKAIFPSSIVTPPGQTTTINSPFHLVCACIDVANIPGIVTLDSTHTIATFTPVDSGGHAIPLQPSTGYTATITTDVEDTQFNHLASQKQWSFTTAASAPPTITISSVSPTSPKWGIDPVVVSGTSTNALGDTVTIKWGDGTANTTGITINNDGSWSTSATQAHKYASTAAGTQPTLVAQLIANCDELSTCAGPFDSRQLTTVKAHTTSLTLAPVSNNTAGTSLDAVGQLVDQDLASSPGSSPSTSQISGMPISITGTNPVFSTIQPNDQTPIKTAGVSFTDLSTGFVNIHQCTNCAPDSGAGGAAGNNKVLHLHTGSTIDLPPGITQVSLSIQDMGSSSFTFDYTTSDNAVHSSNKYVGVTPASGYLPPLNIVGGQVAGSSNPLSVKQIKITGITDSSPTAPDNPIPGTVGIAQMTLQNLFGNPTDLATIDFEDLTTGASTYPATAANPFTLDSGLYFSVAKSQSTPQSSPLLQIQAHFAPPPGNKAYLSSDSATQSYFTVPSTDALGTGTDTANQVTYSGAVYSNSGKCGTNPITGAANNDIDADGICDNWETPNPAGTDLAHGNPPDGSTPNACPLGHDCIPITTQTGALQYYDLCYNDAFSNVWSPSSPANTLVCPTVGHKDIFLEVDYMQGQKPDTTLTTTVTGAIPMVIKAFGHAPITKNADGTNTVAPNGLTNSPTTGIALHVVVDEQAVVHKALFNVWKDSDTDSTNDFASVKLAHFGTPNERAAAGWSTGCPTTPSSAGAIQCPRDAKAQVYHYALFINNWSTKSEGCGPTGVSEMPGNDIVVALGGIGCGLGGSNGFGGSTGTPDQQAGTLMHELGHNLDLNHGGPLKFLKPDGLTLDTSASQPTDSPVNCKPNYLSVMSYTRQLPPGSFVGSYPVGTAWENQGLNYSPLAPNTFRNTLSEGQLSQTAGIGTLPTGQSQNTVVWGIPASGTENFAGVTTAAPGVDWDKTPSTSSPVSIDADNVKVVNCPTSTPSTIESYSAYDDWDNLQLNFRPSSVSQDGVYHAAADPSEITGPMYQTLLNEAFAAQGFSFVQPIVNTGKCPGCTSGSTIPVKFQLKDIKGNFITTAKVTFTAQQINPTTGALIPNTFFAAQQPFSYSASTNTYQYNWKTPTTAGTYVLKLYMNYGNSATQQLLVGKGQTDSTLTLVLS